MALRTEIFEIPARKGMAVLQKKLQKWLTEHDHIEIVSTEFAAYADKIGYILIYADVYHQPEIVRYDSFQQPPAQHSPPVAPMQFEQPQYQEQFQEPYHQEPQMEQAPVQQDAPQRPKGFTTDALFGNLKTFE